MNSFEPTTVEELKGIINRSSIKTSTEDPLPANVLKLIIDEALPCITKLINQSLKEGTMDGVKLSVLRFQEVIQNREVL